MITRRRFLRSTAAAAGVVGLYTWRWEPHWVEVVERRLALPHLPDRLQGSRLIQLSDLHIGPQVADDYLSHVFHQVRELRPEIVVYTGDFTSYSRDVVPHAQRVFAQLPLGSRATFGIMGNHDYGPSWAHPEVAEKIALAATAVGVTVLRNQIAEIEGLQVVGLDDLWALRFDPARALANLDPRQAALVLSHNPDTVDEPGWGDYAGWILSGHTHGGQCKPPFLPAPLLPVRNRRYTAGAFALSGGRHMYISRGVGHLLRVRFNARPEITLFRLERA